MGWLEKGMGLEILPTAEISLIRGLSRGVYALGVWLCCTFLFLFAAGVTAGEESGERIAAIAYYSGTMRVEPPPLLRNRGGVAVGAPLSRHAIQQSIKALYATQQYSQIEVYVEERSEGLVLSYHLTPFARVQAIEIMGISDPRFKGDIENALRSRVGGRYVPAVAKEDTARVARVCEAYGYFRARVTVAEGLTEAGSLVYEVVLGVPASITRLAVQGNTAISTNRLKAVCSFSLLSPIYNRFEVGTDIAAMLRLYHRQRYPSAVITANFAPETGILQFHIDEGKAVAFEFIGQFSESVRKAFEADIISLLVSTGSATMWERRVTSYFQAKGYHDTRVTTGPPNAARIVLVINPGRRYVIKRVTFSGNRAFSDVQLLREMTLKPRNGFVRNLAAWMVSLLFQRDAGPFFSELTLQTDMHRLEILYAKAGYPKAVIRPNLNKLTPTDEKTGGLEIGVTIVEARKEMIHRCELAGNAAVATETLLQRLESELVLPQPNASLARKAYTDAVLKAYYELGYIDAQVSNTYIFESGVPVFRVPGNFSESLEGGRLPVALRSAFEQHHLTLTGIYIATSIGSQWSLQDIEGNPRYTLKQEATQIAVFEHGVLQLNVESEGDRVIFGRFHFEGDTAVVKPHVLDREVEPLVGTLWTSEKLSGALQRLYGLGLFRSIRDTRLPQVVETAGSVSEASSEGAEQVNDVLITLAKQEARTYSVSSGYSFADGFRGTLALTDSNFLFKRNTRGRVRGRLGWRDELGYLFDATLTEPWLIGRTRGSLQVLAKKLEVDDNVRALQGSFILSRDLSESHHLDLRYSYRDLNQPGSGVAVDAVFPSLASDPLNPFRTTVSSVRFSWTYDSRVRYLNPTAGMLNALTLEYAGGFLQGETSFIKTTTDTRYYQRLVGGLVLATAARFGVTTGLRSNRRAELISFERFWAGGGTTVRGYAERSLGPEDSTGTHRGDVQFIFNTELRFPIYWWVRGAVFFDTGNVWQDFADIDTSEPLPASVGAGLYLDLGALTAGIDYAIPFVSVPGALDANRAFHVRLGSTF